METREMALASAAKRQIKAAQSRLAIKSNILASFCIHGIICFGNYALA